MNDNQSTVAELRQLVDAFVAQRDWHQFHTPKNLSMALAIEAAELMEHFQWLTVEESVAVASKPTELAAVAEELDRFKRMNLAEYAPSRGSLLIRRESTRNGGLAGRRVSSRLMCHPATDNKIRPPDAWCNGGRSVLTLTGRCSRTMRKPSKVKLSGKLFFT